MKFKGNLKRITARFALLAVLLFCLGFVATTDLLSPTARANTCCSICGPDYQECLETCSQYPFIGCRQNCQRGWEQCVATCDPNC